MGFPATSINCFGIGAPKRVPLPPARMIAVVIALSIYCLGLQQSRQISAEELLDRHGFSSDDRRILWMKFLSERFQSVVDFPPAAFYFDGNDVVAADDDEIHFRVLIAPIVKLILHPALC